MSAGAARQGATLHRQLPRRLERAVEVRCLLDAVRQRDAQQACARARGRWRGRRRGRARAKTATTALQVARKGCRSCPPPPPPIHAPGTSRRSSASSILLAIGSGGPVVVTSAAAPGTTYTDRRGGVRRGACHGVAGLRGATSGRRALTRESPPAACRRTSPATRSAHSRLLEPPSYHTHVHTDTDSVDTVHPPVSRTPPFTHRVQQLDEGRRVHRVAAHCVHLRARRDAGGQPRARREHVRAFAHVDVRLRTDAGSGGVRVLAFADEGGGSRGDVTQPPRHCRKQGQQPHAMYISSSFAIAAKGHPHTTHTGQALTVAPVNGMTKGWPLMTAAMERDGKEVRPWSLQARDKGGGANGAEGRGGGGGIYCFRMSRASRIRWSHLPLPVLLAYTYARNCALASDARGTRISTRAHEHARVGHKPTRAIVRDAAGTLAVCVRARSLRRVGTPP